MKTKNLTLFVLFLLAVSVSGELCAQAVPVPVLKPKHPWHYETNAGGTQNVEWVHISTVPAGIGIETDSVFRHTTFNVQWDQWWWCAAISFQPDPVAFTNETKVLKMKVFSEEMTKYFIVVKQANEQEIIRWENYPIEPGKWNTIEVDLSTFVGQNVGKFELLSQLPNQVVYFYPYFEDPAPQPKVTAIAPVADMVEQSFTFTFNDARNFYDVSIVDAAGLDIPVPITDKVFKIHAQDPDGGWIWWWNVGINLKDTPLVPENEDEVLVAQIYSPHHLCNLLQKADDGTILNSAYNWGTRDLIPNKWNEIVMDYISPHRGWTFLKTIELTSYIPGIDLYCYFYWAKKDDLSSIRQMKPELKNIKIVGNQIVVEGASDIKQYTATGALVNSGREGSVQALKGLNIIVADGVAYKVIYK